MSLSNASTWVGTPIRVCQILLLRGPLLSDYYQTFFSSHVTQNAPASDFCRPFPGRVLQSYLPSKKRLILSFPPPFSCRALFPSSSLSCCVGSPPSKLGLERPPFSRCWFNRSPELEPRPPYKSRIEVLLFLFPPPRFSYFSPYDREEG